MFAAPKMPNLIACSLLGGVGGLNADQIRPMAAVIFVELAVYLCGVLEQQSSHVPEDSMQVFCVPWVSPQRTAGKQFK
jgi:hypothetical protein